MRPYAPTSVRPACLQPTSCRLGLYVYLLFLGMTDLHMEYQYAMSASIVPAPCQEACNGIIVTEGICLSIKVKTSHYHPSRVRAGARAAGVRRCLVSS